ncbi:MAG: hypothetical protein ACXVBE_05825 [Bdellovibrionota bacterium]
MSQNPSERMLALEAAALDPRIEPELWLRSFSTFDDRDQAGVLRRFREQNIKLPTAMADEVKKIKAQYLGKELANPYWQ